MAYYAAPRATHDIDVNVFIATAAADQVQRTMRSIAGDDFLLPLDAINRDGQIRCWWESTPIDFFFSYDDIHTAMRDQIRFVPFGDASIPVLSPEFLIVCKASFDRPKDWIDIATIAAARTEVAIGIVLQWLAHIVGDDDPRLGRLNSLFPSPTVE